MSLLRLLYFEEGIGISTMWHEDIKNGHDGSSCLLFMKILWGSLLQNGMVLSLVIVKLMFNK
jgi:hypothetical protein